ncbi:hypothetical protein BW13_08835 [Bifidobacterium sp. UTCIF-37]|nr:hypothetical protein BW13_08835 [Bifidobacterium sp. UTCIF-37]TPF87862.1 hypothetical protein BW11_09485 [Bifidobacterium sp. UTCIF-38]
MLQTHIGIAGRVEPLGVYAAPQHGPCCVDDLRFLAFRHDTLRTGFLEAWGVAIQREGGDSQHQHRGSAPSDLSAHIHPRHAVEGHVHQQQTGHGVGIQAESHGVATVLCSPSHGPEAISFDDPA